MSEQEGFRFREDVLAASIEHIDELGSWVVKVTHRTGSTVTKVEQWCPSQAGAWDFLLGEVRG